MQFYGKVVRCDNPECGLPVFRQKANRDLKDEEIKELLTTGKTSLLKGSRASKARVSMPLSPLMPTSTRYLSSPK